MVTKLHHYQLFLSETWIGKMMWNFFLYNFFFCPYNFSEINSHTLFSLCMSSKRVKICPVWVVTVLFCWLFDVKFTPILYGGSVVVSVIYFATTATVNFCKVIVIAFWMKESFSFHFQLTCKLFFFETNLLQIFTKQRRLSEIWLNGLYLNKES